MAQRTIQFVQRGGRAHRIARFLVLGAGFTGLRVVRLLQQDNSEVIWTKRLPREGALGFDAAQDDYSALLPLLSPDITVLYSLPTLRRNDQLWDATPALMKVLRNRSPRRVVYLSTTGVYGDAREVNEQTPTGARTTREQLRVEAEQCVLSGPWTSLVLRPAAIYGPNRGIHASMRAGKFQLPDNPHNFVSRIHVDDLAQHAYSALLSHVEGAFPVADQEPCTSLEAAAYCSQLLGIPLPGTAPVQSLGETRRADRRVDGSAIRKLLGMSLLYPSYRTGFPACLAEEARERSIS